MVFLVHRKRRQTLQYGLQCLASFSSLISFTPCFPFSELQSHFPSFMPWKPHAPCYPHVAPCTLNMIVRSFHSVSFMVSSNTNSVITSTEKLSLSNIICFFPTELYSHSNGFFSFISLHIDENLHLFCVITLIYIYLSYYTKAGIMFFSFCLFDFA